MTKRMLWRDDPASPSAVNKVSMVVNDEFVGAKEAELASYAFLPPTCRSAYASTNARIMR